MKTFSIVSRFARYAWLGRGKFSRKLRTPGMHLNSLYAVRQIISVALLDISRSHLN